MCQGNEQYENAKWKAAFQVASDFLKVTAANLCEVVV
jgi:hypothetical protein